MSNRLENIDLLELVDRYNYLIKQYVDLSLEIAPKLEKFGKYKNELQIISSEFCRRGFKPEDPDGLRGMIEEELNKRNKAENGVQTTDSNERDTESR